MRAIGFILVIIGLLFMVFGALFTFFTFGLGIFCTWPLILVGFILLIIGVALPSESHPAQQQPIIIQQPQPAQQPQSQKQGARYCPNCGREIPFDARICPYCGRNFEN